MLIRGKTAWSTGAAAAFHDHFLGHQRLLFAVRCRLGSSTVDELAFLDTGSRWTLISEEIAQSLHGGLMGPLGATPVTISSRVGEFKGIRHRVSMTLLADAGLGQDLLLDVPCLVVPEWPGPPIFLGYEGLLGDIRFAFEPPARAAATPYFFFGRP